jgi:hypothetical protein
MDQINTARLLIGALIAGVIYFVFDGIIHGAILGAEHEAVIVNAGKPVENDPTAYAYFGLFDFGKGLVAMVFYVMARARLGAGPITAVWAGVFAWFAVEVVPSIAQMPFPFYGQVFFVKLMAMELVPMIVGAVAGAWIYREGASSTAAA